MNKWSKNIPTKSTTKDGDFFFKTKRKNALMMSARAAKKIELKMSAMMIKLVIKLLIVLFLIPKCAGNGS